MAKQDSATPSHERFLDITRFVQDCAGCGLRINNQTALRLAASLAAKRFLILTGLAGSGKTKVAQAFCRWIAPSFAASDPFQIGTTIRGSKETTTYTITAADSLGIEVESNRGPRMLLPRGIIEEWADFIEKKGIRETIGSQELRTLVKNAGSAYSGALHDWETHYKPAAFLLVAARKTAAQVKCCELVAVGADWTNADSILGYTNGLSSEEYVTKSGLDLILRAKANPQEPHFLILDEMNLSHVERYFAEILSAIESEEEIHLHHDRERKANGQPIPGSVRLPTNLFVIGTVNVDETTYMFSPKVLDRANVIEFRMDGDEMKEFLGGPFKPNLADLDGKGHAGFGRAFVKAARANASLPADVVASFAAETLVFFNTLHAHGAEFGYRVGHEAARFLHFYKALGNHREDGKWFREAYDCVIVQKFLPKLHGSRAKLGPLLKALWFLCLHETDARGADPVQAALDAARSADKKAEPSVEQAANAHYPLSADKLARMWRMLRDNGFASFAEA